jgi:hypothetical protein
MQSSTPLIDIHVHSTIKPYGNSFYDNCNPTIASDMSCIWRQDKFTEDDKAIENLVGIPRYRQSDFTTLVDGQVRIVCVSLYPIETGMVNLREGSLLKSVESWVAQFAGLLGKVRINYILGKQNGEPYNYFKDLCREYQYLLSLNNIKPEGGVLSYSVINNSNGLDNNSNNSLLVIPTIEGCHSFCDGTDTRNAENWLSLVENVKTVKDWQSPPLFVTFAHHFYNGLCTHATSLFEIAGKLANQEYGMRDYEIPINDDCKPIEEIGEQLIHLLLSKNNGRRILIDIKHMSLEARNAYYNILTQAPYANENIPIICSHGAIQLKKLTQFQINLELENDVLKIYQSNGLFGLELDQRILGYNSNRFFKWVGNIFKKKSKQAFNEAAYFWDQIITIAEFAYANGFRENPWKCICLGSDYDGVINPLNTYRDASNLSVLYQNLISYLENYWSQNNCIIPPKNNGLDAQDVIYNIMYRNAFEFIKLNYN